MWKILIHYCRLDWVILPPLVLAFFALQLDRGNMWVDDIPTEKVTNLELTLSLSGAAFTDLFTFEIGITQDQYNTGNTLMSVGIVLLEVSRLLIWLL